MRGIVAGLVLLLSYDAAAKCIADTPVDITIRLQMHRGTAVFQKHQERITSGVAAYFQPSINIRFTDDPAEPAEFELGVRRKTDWCGKKGLRSLCALFGRSSQYGWAYLDGPKGEVYVFRSHEFQESKNADMYVDLTSLVMTHEVGHLLGLDHNEMKGNIMNATLRTITNAPMNCAQREQAYNGAVSAKNNL
jgi:hypothetical protein